MLQKHEKKQQQQQQQKNKTNNNNFYVKQADNTPFFKSGLLMLESYVNVCYIDSIWSWIFVCDQIVFYTIFKSIKATITMVLIFIKHVENHGMFYKYDLTHSNRRVIGRNMVDLKSLLYC